MKPLKIIMIFTLCLAFCMSPTFAAALEESLAPKQQSVPGATNVPRVVTNQSFIEGLYSEVDVEDPDQIFNLVFSSLDDEVTIYPTENYYYFNLHIAGETIWGNLRLDANDRDQGIIHLGYFRYNDNGEFQDKYGRSKSYSQKDGVVVSRLDAFLYAISYREKTVKLRLNDVGFTSPGQEFLRGQEAFVGHIFDESGIRFYLLFDEESKHFFYVLNEAVPTPDDFVELSALMSMGRRTGFVFFSDKKFKRKILVAVHGRSIERNNYYDGPFDQLPDNYADQSRIRERIEEAYPYTKGKINRFGNFLSDPDNRVAIMPYHIYFAAEKDLSFVDSCISSDLPEADFYACITPDYKQLHIDRGPQLAAFGGITFSGQVENELGGEATDGR